MRGFQRAGRTPKLDPKQVDADLIPPDFLRALAVWSVIPAYVLAGAFVGYFLDLWLRTSPYLLGVGLLLALILAVRDMWRIRDEFERRTGHDD